MKKFERKKKKDIKKREIKNILKDRERIWAVRVFFWPR